MREIINQNLLGLNFTRIAVVVPAIGFALLTACSNDSVQQNDPARQKEQTIATAAPRKYPVVSKAETPLVLEISVNGNPASPIITGDTNLPDGTHLNINVAQGDRYMVDGADVSVSSGHFASDPLKLRGDPMTPGKYVIEVGSPLADIQPQFVRQIVGAEYENLTGPILSEGQLGRTIKLQRDHTVPGPRDRQAERSRDLKRDAEVRAFYQRSCEETETRHGRPTRTPRAKAIIADCVRDFEAGLPN